MKKIGIVLIALLFSINPMHSQEQKEETKIKEKINVKFKEGAKPLIIVDGKRFDFSIDLIDSKQIESVTVLKEGSAKKLYNTTNGVVLITTKNATSELKTKIELGENPYFKTNINGKKPLVIIDGKISTETNLMNIKTKNIERIDVFKGKAAKETYNAPNGVVVITTKKKKKS